MALVPELQTSEKGSDWGSPGGTAAKTVAVSSLCKEPLLSSSFRLSERPSHVCRSKQSLFAAPFSRICSFDLSGPSASVADAEFAFRCRSDRSVGRRTDRRGQNSAQEISSKDRLNSLAVRRRVASYTEASRAAHLSLDLVQLRQGLALPAIMKLSLAGLHRPSKYTMRVFRTTLFVSLAAGLFGCVVQRGLSEEGLRADRPVHPSFRFDTGR